MDNLPTDKNQPVDNNQKVTNDNPPPVTPPETPPISTTETPPKKKPETTQIPPEEPKPEEKINEQPIEVGSLEQPAFTSYTQASITDDPGTKKNKKIKTIASVLGILLIVAALPLSVILVKQRQEIRKEAASGTVTTCGVTISTSGSGSFNGSNFTGSYSLNNTSGKNVEMTIRLDGCACDEGNVGQCNSNCNTSEKTITLPPGQSTQSITTPSKNNCGTFQTDLKVMSCRQL